jgi:hypothetical protein
MFDATDVFTLQFTRTDGGYLYYPSPKAGGKLVTREEYERLLANWQRVAGPRGVWTAAALIVGVILLWTILDEASSLPGWTGRLIAGGCAAALVAWFLWAGFAPRRLVSGRPDVAPPRLRSELGREARAMVSWHIVALALLLSGAALFHTLRSPETTTLVWWAWLIGSGAMFCSYIWIAVQKVSDRQG